jgi:hypothetical protein
VGLEATHGFPYRILSLVADATKVYFRRKPQEIKAPMAFEQMLWGFSASVHGQKTDGNKLAWHLSRWRNQFNRSVNTMLSRANSRSAAWRYMPPSPEATLTSLHHGRLLSPELG